MAYSDPADKTVAELEAELRVVFEAYPEHQERGFDGMVREFASDDFYKLHLVAKAYLIRSEAK